MNYIRQFVIIQLQLQYGKKVKDFNFLLKLKNLRRDFVIRIFFSFKIIEDNNFIFFLLIFYSSILSGMNFMKL